MFYQQWSDTEWNPTFCLFFSLCLPQSVKSTESQKTFGGFKKGFLTNSKPRKGNPTPSSKPAKKDTEDVPVIRPKNPEQKAKGMEIPEVQEAMKSSIPGLENKGHLLRKSLNCETGVNFHITAPPTFFYCSAYFWRQILTDTFSVVIINLHLHLDCC